MRHPSARILKRHVTSANSKRLHIRLREFDLTALVILARQHPKLVLAPRHRYRIRQRHRSVTRYRIHQRTQRQQLHARCHPGTTPIARPMDQSRLIWLRH